MDYYGLNRLTEEQQRALANTEQDIQKWNKFKKDYIALQTKIKDLPSQVTYDYMVPFGPLAMMPGQLIHTNEIMVLLGDNWFAEMSAKESCEVIDRRLADVEKSIKRLNEQKKLLESRRDFTQNQFAAGEMDIREEYDSDEDKKWRESHRANLRRERAAKKEETACRSQEDILERLEALQLQEMRGRDMHRLTEELQQSKEVTESNGEGKAANPRKAVHWGADDTESTSLTLTAADDSSDEEEDSTSCSTIDSDDSYTSTPAVIHFKHSPRSEEEGVERGADKHSEDSIGSPSDIYRLYHKPNKSILKHERTFEEVKGNIRQHPESKPTTRTRDIQFVDSKTTAVQSHVVEKPEVPKVGSQARLVEETHTKPSLSSTTSEPSESKPAARISKFKALRQKQKS